jgi:RNase adaptor protein for sRNA GlmZ degradation
MSSIERHSKQEPICDEDILFDDGHCGVDEIKLIAFEYKYGPPKRADLAIFIKNYQDPATESHFDSTQSHFDSTQSHFDSTQSHFDSTKSQVKMNGVLSCLQVQFGLYDYPVLPETGKRIDLDTQIINHIKTITKDKNKSYCLIAIGCEGGKHLSFQTIRELKLHIRNRTKDLIITTSHRNTV